MANHDWSAMPYQPHANRPDVFTPLGSVGSVTVPPGGMEATAAAAGIASSRAASTAILVETGHAWQGGGCGSAGAFGGGALLALPLLLAAAFLRRFARRR